jgi:hypothetical protein
MNVLHKMVISSFLSAPPPLSIILGCICISISHQATKPVAIKGGKSWSPLLHAILITKLQNEVYTSVILKVNQYF